MWVLNYIYNLCNFKYFEMLYQRYTFKHISYLISQNKELKLFTLFTFKLISPSLLLLSCFNIVPSSFLQVYKEKRMFHQSLRNEVKILDSKDDKNLCRQ